MTSQQAYDLILCDVDCRRGSPMGRANVGEKPTDKRIFNRRVPLIYDGAYDKGGAYWGMGKELRVEYTSDLTYIMFYRV